MIDPKRLERILDRIEELEGSIACMTCGSTLTRDEYQQLEDAIDQLRQAYIFNVERG